MGRVSDARERLVDSALELVHARSYADVGVQELCDHAGVKKGSFYHFFASKEDLILEALQCQWERVKEAVLDGAFAKDQRPLKRLERLFERTYGYQRSFIKDSGQLRGCFFGNLALELSTQEEVIRKKVAKIFDATIAIIEDTLDEAVANGDLPVIDTPAAAEAILTYWEGALLLAKVRNDPSVIRRAGKGAIGIARSRPAKAPAGARKRTG